MREAQHHRQDAPQPPRRPQHRPEAFRAAHYAQLSHDPTTRTCAQERDVAFSGSVRKLGDLIHAITEPNAENIHAATGAVKALAEIALTREVLDAGDGGEDQSDSEARREDRPPAATLPN